MPNTLKSLHVCLCTLLLAVVAVGLVDYSGAQIPDKFTNLTVLPRDINQKDLVDLMKSMTFDLGTRCWFCHKGEGDDLANYDFASDENEHKLTARRHMRMTREVNEKYFQGTDEDHEVTCYTCHRGEAEPETN